MGEIEIFSHKIFFINKTARTGIGKNWQNINVCPFVPILAVTPQNFSKQPEWALDMGINGAAPYNDHNFNLFDFGGRVCACYMCS